MVGMGKNILETTVTVTETSTYLHHRRQQQLDSQFFNISNMTTLIASLLLFTTAAVLPAATSLSIQQDLSKPNNGVYTSRRYLLRSMSAASVSLGPVVAASSAIEEEEDPSVERSTLKIGGVNVIGWAAAAVILNDVLSNRFSVDSIDGMLPEMKDDDNK